MTYSVVYLQLMVDGLSGQTSASVELKGVRRDSRFDPVVAISQNQCMEGGLVTETSMNVSNASTTKAAQVSIPSGPIHYTRGPLFVTDVHVCESPVLQ